MKLVDANVLLYSVNSSAVHHEASRQWLSTALAGTETVGLPWLSLIAFLRISTMPVLPRPLTTPQATGQVRLWLAAPGATVAHPSARHFDLLEQFLLGTRTDGNSVNDAHLAALALEHNADIVTYDSDFGRFPGVRWHRPGSLI